MLYILFLMLYVYQSFVWSISESKCCVTNTDFCPNHWTFLLQEWCMFHLDLLLSTFMQEISPIGWNCKHKTSKLSYNLIFDFHMHMVPLEKKFVSCCWIDYGKFLILQEYLFQRFPCYVWNKENIKSRSLIDCYNFL